MAHEEDTHICRECNHPCHGDTDICPVCRSNHECMCDECVENECNIRPEAPK